MTGFVCPVCRGNLIENGKVLRCENGHSYDISRRGYVNLLMSQKSSDFHHGDSKEMVKARSEFLSLGLYEKLCDRVSDIVFSAAKKDMFILDIGCGECYYTEKIAQRAADFSPTVCGIDISKEALIAGAKRDKNINLAVASAFDVPVGDGIADVILNLFAPHDDKEFARILKPGGTLVRVFPFENHLYELKCAIYEHPYKNEPDGFDIAGFKMTQNEKLEYSIHLDKNADIRNLFSMTPYSYKTSASDEQKLASLDSLDTKVEFAIITYTKE